MRILHTGDWHLGKYLEGNSRLKEQEKFLQDFIDLVKENNVDLIMIAGDIYDNSNPPAEAERLFYKTLKKLTNNGQRVVLIVSGNHDNPERLGASSPLTFEQGVIIVDKPKTKINTGICGKHKVLESEEGYFKIEINNEIASIITLPYPSEKRLNEVLSISMEDKEASTGYNDRIKTFFNEREHKFSEDTINLIISHLFVLGGGESGSERPIQLGGTFAVNSLSFPKEAQYVALGHLHGMQKMGSGNIYYSGSPIQYSKNEANQSKGCYIIDIKKKMEPIVEEVLFKNYKPIDIWKCNDIEEAIEKCKQNHERDSWVYLEIKTDRVIEQNEIKEMKAYKNSIIEIKPIIKELDDEDSVEDLLSEKSMEDLFKEFFKERKKVEPTKNLMNMFREIAQGEEDINEA